MRVIELDKLVVLETLGGPLWGQQHAGFLGSMAIRIPLSFLFPRLNNLVFLHKTQNPKPFIESTTFHPADQHFFPSVASGMERVLSRSCEFRAEHICLTLGGRPPSMPPPRTSSSLLVPSCCGLLLSLQSVQTPKLLHLYYWDTRPPYLCPCELAFRT